MDCCKINNKNVKKCLRKKDNKVFTFPRLYSKNDCMKLKTPIKGFTRRASCAPYKYCKRKEISKSKKKKQQTKQMGGRSKSKNIYKKKLKICSTNPMTGYYRNGYCETGFGDVGTHTVCSVMDDEFLKYTASKGNDLSSVVKPGDKWCLCEYRWNEAFDSNKAPKVITESTNFLTKKNIVKNIKINNKKKSKSSRKSISYSRQL